MNDNDRLILQNLINKNNTTEQTDLIRQLQHSEILKSQINLLVDIKNQHFPNEQKIHEEGSYHCEFLYKYYTDIYNKVRKDEIDLLNLFKMLDLLKEIEDGQIDQHDASYKVGMFLKEIYIDSALRKSEKLDKLYSESNNEEKKEIVDISWKDYKKQLIK